MNKRDVLCEDVYHLKSAEIEKAMKCAIKNAYDIGSGFVVVKRMGHKSEVFIKEMLWHEVEEELRRIGVKGAFGGAD